MHRHNPLCVGAIFLEHYTPWIMKKFKSILKIFGILIIAFLLFFFWYNQRYSMEVGKSYSVNTPEASRHIVIAAQGSAYKNTIVENVVDNLKERDLFIRVYDVGELKNIIPSQWDAILVLHTWEYGKPPKSVREFSKRTTELSNVIFFSTSGSGEEYIRGIDGITGASRMSQADQKSGEVLDRINRVLDKGLTSG